MVEASAEISMAGMDVYRFLATASQRERGLMQRIAARRMELDLRRDERLAVLIRNQVLEGLAG